MSSDNVAEALTYQPLSDDCLSGAFSCGERDVDRWFRKRGHKAHGAFECRVTTVHAPGIEAPVGFYALAFIVEEERHLIGFERSRERFPALHLEWLAVHTDYQKRGLGEIIMGRVLDIYVRSVLETGLPAMTLVALNERVEKFYFGLGFRRYALNDIGGGRRMLLPRQAALELN